MKSQLGEVHTHSAQQKKGGKNAKKNGFNPDYFLICIPFGRFWSGPRKKIPEYPTSTTESNNQANSIHDRTFN